MTLNTFSLVLHVLSAVVWVGGMLFAHMFLRPVVAAQLEPAIRLPLWVGIFKRFFPMVWLAVLFLPLTGYLMIVNIWGDMAHTPIYIHVMTGFGIMMILIFLHVYFAPFKRLKEAVIKQDWPEGGRNLNIIRKMVGINTIIGFFIIIVASGGRMFV